MAVRVTRAAQLRSRSCPARRGCASRRAWGMAVGTPPCTHACVWSPPAACPPRTAPWAGVGRVPACFPAGAIYAKSPA